MDGEYLGCCMVHSGASHILKSDLWNQELESQKKQQPQNVVWTILIDVRTRAQKLTHTAGYSVRSEQSVGKKNLWHSTEAGKTLIGRIVFFCLFFCPFCF